MLYNSQALAQAATLACLLEVSAEKPGNVTPTRSFRDMTYEDFLWSAVAIGPEMGRAGERGVGETILAAVEATRRVTRANTNLGLVLLLAPLAKAARQLTGVSHQSSVASRQSSVVSHQSPVEETSDQENGLRITHFVLRESFRAELHNVLHSLTVEDAKAAYAAIRQTFPGGLQERVERHDVRDEPTVTLRQAMAEAVGRDSIAAEYLTDFAIVFERGLPALEAALARGLPCREAVTQTYLELLAAEPDSLIARKLGQAAAMSVSYAAARVLAADGVFSAEGRQAAVAFDGELRDPENALNPGTTADLTGAVLFVALLLGIGI